MVRGLCGVIDAGIETVGVSESAEVGLAEAVYGFCGGGDEI